MTNVYREETEEKKSQTLGLVATAKAFVEYAYNELFSRMSGRETNAEFGRTVLSSQLNSKRTENLELVLSKFEDGKTGVAGNLFRAIGNLSG
ncbi:MAG: hypothetical protein WCT31_04620 [Candidatus Micrarchaeia archaeon]|jgi:hypothetical protein